MSLTSLRFFVLMDLLLLFALQNHGCTGGKVLDENGLPLIGAKVLCDDLPAIGPAFTDLTGMYKWPDTAIPEGPHSFTISMAGYESLSVRATVKYAVAPGHVAAEGLVFQIPDVRLRKIGSGLRDKGGGAKPLPPGPISSDRVPEPSGLSTKDPIAGAGTRATSIQSTLATLPPPTFPTLPPPTMPATVAAVKPPKVLVTTTIVSATLTFPTLPPVRLPTTTLPRTPIAGATTVPAFPPAGTVASIPKPSATVSNLGVGIAPPGQQWYQSPDQKYSFSAPLSWKVGFQGSKAVIEFVPGSCTLMQILVQVNDSGRPKGNVIREIATVFSGMSVRQQTYDNGMEGFFFSCGGDSYSIFKVQPEACTGNGLEAAGQEAMLIITSVQCRQ